MKDALHSALCLIGAFMYMEIFIQNYDMHCCIYVSKMCELTQIYNCIKNKFALLWGEAQLCLPYVY